jgi:hypothetical protein
MVMRMKSVSPFGLDLDYESWDGSVMHSVTMAIGRAICKWYCDGNDKARMAIFEESSQSMQFIGMFVFILSHGLASGMFMTAPLNSLINEVGLRIAYMTCTPLPWGSMFYYRKHVRTSIYGDDVIAAVVAFLLAFFNQQTIIAFFLKHGVKCTTADKKVSTTPYKMIEELSFLKCSLGSKLDGRYVPGMERDANLESISWIRANKDITPDDLCNDSCNCVLRSEFYRSRDDFEEVRNCILYYKPEYNLVTYGQLYNEFHEIGFIHDEYNSFGFSRNTNPSKPN